MYGIKWYRQAGVRMYLIEIVTSYDISQQFNSHHNSLTIPYNFEYQPSTELPPSQARRYQSSPDSHPARTKARTRLVPE